MTEPFRSGDTDIPVVILCGGQGTRIRDVDERLPKPLIEIGGRPILWHIMKTYSQFGFRRFVLCLGYKGWLIKDYFLRYREHQADFTISLSDDHEPRYLNKSGDENWEVTCAETGELTATGARLWRVRDWVDSDTFMFTYGDGIGSIDLPGLLDFHRASGRIATVTGVRPTSRYGEMQVEGDMVVEFNEKPTTPAGWVSGGFFVFDRRVFDYLDDDPDLFLEYRPLQQLARDEQLAVFCHEGFWMGMDTYRDYVHLNEMWQSGNAPWKVWDG